MLMESVLSQALSVKRFRVEKIEEAGTGYAARIAARWNTRPVCRLCGRKGYTYDQLKKRQWRFLPVWGRQCLLEYTPRRVKCRHCSRISVEHMPWSMGKSPLSRHLIGLIAVMTRLLSWQEVSRLVGVHWNTIRSAVKSAVEYGLIHRDVSEVRCIGVDEISRRKGHVYQTNVYDLENKRLLWTGSGRSAHTLEQFFRDWGTEATEKLRVICIDMWDPYVKMIRKYAPHALMVFDKFHVVKHLNDAVDSVRKQEAQDKTTADADLLKGTKYIWLKNPVNLTDTQKKTLKYLETINLRTTRAYLLKDQFARFWTYTYPACAEKFLDWWCTKAMRSRLEPLKKFVKTLRRHKANIMTYFHFKVTNAMSEGMNRKAKVMSARAYGYRTPGTFALALYHNLGALPLPETTHRFL